MIHEMVIKLAQAYRLGIVIPLCLRHGFTAPDERDFKGTVSCYRA